MGKKVCLMIIDPQLDFTTKTGALYVDGADQDMERLAKMVHRIKGDLRECLVTLDSHRTLHIAHPLWWCDQSGKSPAPFTLITVADVIGSSPKWKARNPVLQKRSEEYVQKLAQNNRYVLCIWPVHCRIGSVGHSVHPELFNALCAWEDTFAAVNYVTKGSNIYTEHYSAVQADVYDHKDPTTGLNTDLIKTLQEMDLIAIAGEASSHCVKFTTLDIANNFGEDNIKKFVFLEDASSPVKGFEKEEVSFLDEMTKRGMQITTTDKFLR